ncbi:IstB-like ATP-binding protein [Streptomyces azureus]|uniref:IstB-like ATP-binding protein n=1 Tax=Streptomyces azureus TaxID=146537 RepID=A0A0K8PPE5_STRAJ|nr:IstB-like ATP-binding protein [Streptomyces azureus]
MNELVEAADEKQLNKTLARYGRVDLLCIDELGYMEPARHDAELLFQVVTEHEEKNSVTIASKESFGGGRRRSPTPVSARPSATASPSTAPSSKPAPTPTDLPGLGHVLNMPRRAEGEASQPLRPKGHLLRRSDNTR